jgi:hypothetical protein
MLPYRQALVFTGHMLDAPDRAVPRFPSTKIASARSAISEVVRRTLKAAAGSLIGLGSGARGGDILFLEVLRDNGIPFRMFLPFEPARFLDTSVRGVSPDWEDRFWSLWNGLPPENREDLALPVTDEAFAACNARMLDVAQRVGEEVRLLALWDGKDTELKPGGTAHFIESVRAIHGQITIIDAVALSTE